MNDSLKPALYKITVERFEGAYLVKGDPMIGYAGCTSPHALPALIAESVKTHEAALVAGDLSVPPPPRRSWWWWVRSLFAAKGVGH